MTALRVRIRREDDGVDYGWVRVDELPYLITAMAATDGLGMDDSGV